MGENLNIERKKRSLLIKALNSRESIKQAGKALGVSLRQVYMLMERYDVERDPKTKMYSAVGDVYEKERELLDETKRFSKTVVSGLFNAEESLDVNMKVIQLCECIETLYSKAVLNLKRFHERD